MSKQLDPEEIRSAVRQELGLDDGARTGLIIEDGVTSLADSGQGKVVDLGYTGTDMLHIGSSDAFASADELLPDELEFSPCAPKENTCRKR